MTFIKGDEYLAALLDGIHRAKQSIYAEMYLMRYSPAEHHPVREIALALKSASERGVRVDVVLDRALLKDNQAAAGALERFGVPARLGPKSPVNHSKLVIVDGEWILCGSQNWTISGLASNLETAVAIRDRAMARALARKLKRIEPERIYNVYDDLMAYAQWELGHRAAEGLEAILAATMRGRDMEAAKRLGIGFVSDAAHARGELLRREHPEEVVDEAGIEEASGKYLWPVKRRGQAVDALVFSKDSAAFLQPEGARLPEDGHAILLLVKDPREALRLQAIGIVNAVPYAEADRVVRGAEELKHKDVYLAADAAVDRRAFADAGIAADELKPERPDRLNPEILRESLPQVLYLIQVKQYQNALDAATDVPGAEAAWARGYANLMLSRHADAVAAFVESADLAGPGGLREAAAGWRQAARALLLINR